MSCQHFDLPRFLLTSFSPFTTLSLLLLPSGQALHPARNTNIFFPHPGLHRTARRDHTSPRGDFMLKLLDVGIHFKAWVLLQ